MEDTVAARPEVTSRKLTTNERPEDPRGNPNQPRAPPFLDRAAYTIAEFCAAHRFSRSHYYNLKRRGLGPDETRLGDRVLITVEAAIRWRRQREKPARA